MRDLRAERRLYGTMENPPDTGPPRPDAPGDHRPPADEGAKGSASGTHHTRPYLARYAEVYDAARAEGAGVAEAMAVAEAELARDLERRWLGGGGTP